MSTPLQQLIKVGFTKRQGNELIEQIGAGGGGGGGASDVLSMFKSQAEPAQVPSWAPGADPGPNGWVSVDTLWVDYTVERASDAWAFDEEGGFTYAKPGVYISTLQTQWVPAEGWYGEVSPAMFSISVGDAAYLDHTFQEYGTSVDYLQTTWMGIAETDDYNYAPAINGFAGPNPLQLRTARYTSVRLSD
jgi:hypothetical protein